MPPENFEKLNPLGLNLRTLLMVFYFYNSKTAYTLQNNSAMYIWLNCTKSKGSGGMLPMKIKPSGIESLGIFNGLLSRLLQDSTL